MSTAKITRTFSKFKELEKKYDLDTKIAQDNSNRNKLLPLLCYSQREFNKYVTSIEDIFGKDFMVKRLVMSDEAIDRLSPDTININKFWEKSVNAYPFVSIVGHSNVNTIEEANAATLNNLHAHLKGPNVVSYSWNKNQEDFKILEIGPGYGGFCKWVNNYPNTKYYGIDVNPLFEYPTLYKCDGRNIPSQIPNNLDVVYSYNVFQHLSKKQRTSYYEQIFLALKPGGIFTFSNFVVTPTNFDGPYWGHADKNGNFYTIFFNQYTLIDKIDELKKELEYIGFDLQVLVEFQNSCSFAAIKVKI